MFWRSGLKIFRSRFFSSLEHSVAPKRCSGCGTNIQSTDSEGQGYVPERAVLQFAGSARVNKFKTPKGVVTKDVPMGVEVREANRKEFVKRQKLLICRRCFRLQNYHQLQHPRGEKDPDEVEEKNEKVPKVDDLGGFYHIDLDSETKREKRIIEKIVRLIKPESIILFVVDILDFETSHVPELYDQLKTRHHEVIFLVNKVDCLPGPMQVRMARQNSEIQQWCRRLNSHMHNTKTSNLILISAATGHNFSRLEDTLKLYMRPQNSRWLYVVGRVNSGKSTFVTRFLKHIGYQNLGHVNYRRAVGGATRSCLPGTTCHFLSFALPKGFRIVDTPGIPTISSMQTLFQDSVEDLYDLVPRKSIQTLTYALTEGKSLLIGGMCKIDLVSGATAFVTLYFSHRVTVHLTRTDKANDLLHRKAGDFLYPPFTRKKFFSLFPFFRHKVEVFGGSHQSFDDISIAGLGWFSVSGFGKKSFDVWLPRGVKLFRRPSLLPNEIKSHGVVQFHMRQRARSQRMNHRKKRAVRRLRDRERREAIHRILAEEEEKNMEQKSEEKEEKEENEENEQNTSQYL